MYQTKPPRILLLFGNLNSFIEDLFLLQIIAVSERILIQQRHRIQNTEHLLLILKIFSKIFKGFFLIISFRLSQVYLYKQLKIISYSLFIFQKK